MYLDRDGKVQSVGYRMPAAKKPKGKNGAPADNTGVDDDATVVKTRPDVTRKGMEMIGDLRTDALHEAFSLAPIEDDTVMALHVLAFAGQNVTVASGTRDISYYGRLASANMPPACSTRRAISISTWTRFGSSCARS